MAKDKTKNDKGENYEESPAEKRSKIIAKIEKKHKFITIRETDELLYFNPHDGQWYEGDSFLREFVVEETTIPIIRKKTTDKIIGFSTSIFREIKAILQIKTYVNQKNFVAPIDWINLRNGALNVRTSEFIARDHEPDYTKEEEEIKDLREEMNSKLQKQWNDNKTSDQEYQKRIDEIMKEYIAKINLKKDEIKKKRKEWINSEIEKFAKFCFISSIPVSYDPKATCPKIDKFFGELEIGEEMTKTVFELFGYTLLKAYPIKSMFVFVGPHDTAKSTVANLLEKMLGTDNFSALSLDSIMDDKFEKHKLFGKLANISGELAPKFITTTTLLKELMGSDSISVRMMHTQRNFTFINHAKLIFLTNQLPGTFDDDAFFSKVEILEFHKQFLAGEKNTKSKEELDAELTTDQELSGLLNKSVSALKELLKRGKFRNDRTVKEKKELYLIKSNPLKYYIETALELNEELNDTADPDRNTLRAYKRDLFENYILFCKQHSVPELPDTLFYKKMREYMVKQGKRDQRDNLHGGSYYVDVYIKKWFTDTENTVS